MSAILVALRLSRREIRRARGRSALIMVMIGLPVLLLTAGATWQATGNVNVREGLNWNIGAADASVQNGASDVPVRQSTSTTISFAAGGRSSGIRRELTEREILTLFGPGSRTIPSRVSWTGYQVAGAYREADLREIDLRDPITAGMYELLSGRLPTAAGEVAVSPAMKLRAGSTFTMDGKGAATVVGVVEPRRAPGHLEIVAPPGSVLGGKQVTTAWLVDTPAPVTWQRVREINRHGVVVLSRAVLDDPPPAGDGPEDPVSYDAWRGPDIVMVALAAVVVGLEVVFLAGPAFAVGIRRRRRELALIATQGGSSRHLRGVVLVNGLTLGLAASLLGAAGGIGIGVAVTPFFHRGPFEVPAGWVAFAVFMGVSSALLAAVVPAVQASRADVAEVLAGRRGRAGQRRGLPVLGAVLLTGSLAVIVAGSVLRGRLLQFGQMHTIGLLAGAVLAQLGLILLTPWLVGAAARLAAWLPLPFRMAARDAARNRGRTAPAVAAVLAATTVLAAVAVMISSQNAQRREEYLPEYAMGSTVFSSYAPNPAIWREIKRTAVSALPGVPLIEAGKLTGPGSAPANVVIQYDCEGRCEIPIGAASFRGSPVGGADLVRHFLRRPDPAAEAALAAGKAVVFDQRAVHDGKLVFTTEGEKRTRHSVAAVVRRPPGEPLVAAVLPVSLAARIGLTVGYDTLIADPATSRVTPEQEERLRDVMRDVSPSVAVTVERGFEDRLASTLLAFALGAVVLVLGGTFAATGLAAAEGRPDRATLAAVGATGRAQRLLVAGQAAFVSGLGVAGGLVVGLTFGVMIVLSQTAYRQPVVGGMMRNLSGPGSSAIDIPWLLLGGMLVGLPLLAALLAGACVRTRVVLTRRLA